MYRFCIVCLIVFANACKSNHNKDIDRKEDKTPIIIDIDIKNLENSPISLFDKIEFIPLETNDSSIVGNINYIKFVDNKYYIIVDKQHIVSVFDYKGKYISNSKKCFGNGPKEYYTLLDVDYNRFTDCFDLLNYDGKIKSYDEGFNFTHEVKINSKVNAKYDGLMPVGESMYLLSPSFMEEMNCVYLYDVLNEKLHLLNFEGNLSKLTMTEFPFYTINNKYYYSPRSFNYSVFCVDIIKRKLDEVFTLNVLSGKVNEKELRKYQEDMENRNFLLHSGYVLPLRNLLSDEYVATLILKNNQLYTNVYNIKKQVSKILKNDKNFVLPQFFAIEKNVLYALIYPFEIEKHIDKKLIDEYSLRMFDNMDGELNPVVVKYYLK